jgi:hypothetical protein
MNDFDTPETPLDRRLRALYARLDTAPEFTRRLGARLARERGATDESARRALRERLEAERLRTEARLRWRLWGSLGCALGLAVLAALAAWLFGDVTAAVLGHAAAAAGASRIAIASTLVLVIWLWFIASRAAGGASVQAAFG